MRVYSYIVTHDSGFSPNPFHGHLTLACCKPAIRRTAQVGDWVVGLSKRGERVVYAMRVAEILSFNKYWSDARFAAKVPDKTSASAVVRRGDNIYKPLGADAFHQLPSSHSFKDGTENSKNKAHDLGGVHVLVANEFVYFGGGGLDLPGDLAFLKVGRAHRCKFTQEQVQKFTEWVSSQSRGVPGCPTLWPAGDDSWREHL